MEEIALGPHTRMLIGAVDYVHPSLRAMHTYWIQRRGGRDMPSRADVNPGDLRDHLKWIFLADVLPDMADFRYRLVGTLVAEYFGMDGGGHTLRQVFGPYGEPVVKAMLYIYRKAASGARPVRVTGLGRWNDERDEPFEAIYLPLSDDGKAVNMLLCGFSFDAAQVLTHRAVGREREIGNPVTLG